MSVQLPIVRNAQWQTIDGGEDMPEFPPLWDASSVEIPKSAFGEPASIDGPVAAATWPARPRLFQKIFRNWRGIGATINWAGSVIDCDSYSNYTGIYVANNDTDLRGGQLFNNRDANLWLNGPNGANVQTTAVHMFGARIALYNQGCVDYRSVNDTVADSPVGYYSPNIGAGARVRFTNTLFQHNMVRDVYMRDTNATFKNCSFLVQRQVSNCASLVINDPNCSINLPPGTKKVCADLGWDCEIDGGSIELTNWTNPAHAAFITNETTDGIWINQGGNKIRTHIYDQDQLNATVGCRITDTGTTIGNTQIKLFGSGFNDPDSRLLVVDGNAARCKALDVELHIGGANRAPAGYLDISAGWTGRIRIFMDDKTMTGNNSAVIDIAEGAAV